MLDNIDRIEGDEGQVTGSIVDNFISWINFGNNIDGRLRWRQLMKDSQLKAMESSLL